MSARVGPVFQPKSARASRVKNPSRSDAGPATDSTGTTRSATSDASGAYVISGVSPGPVTLTVTAINYEPITQTIRDVGTLAVKRTVVLDDVPYRLVGIAMLYDTQACRWKIDRIEYQEPQAQ